VQKVRLPIVISIVALLVSIGFSCLTVYLQFFNIEERVQVRVNEIVAECRAANEEATSSDERTECDWAIDVVFFNVGDVPIFAQVSKIVTATVPEQYSLILDSGPGAVVSPKSIVPLLFRDNGMNRYWAGVWHESHEHVFNKPDSAINVRLEVEVVSGRSGKKIVGEMSIRMPTFKSGFDSDCWVRRPGFSMGDHFRCKWANDGTFIELQF